VILLRQKSGINAESIEEMTGDVQSFGQEIPVVSQFEFDPKTSSEDISLG
jgi:hypothetical protein